METPFEAAAFVSFCALLLVLLFRRFYWQQTSARMTLWWTLALLLLAVAGKYAISGYGYVPNRMLIYALAVPRVQGLPWLLLIAASCAALLLWYRNKSGWPRWPRLWSLWLICSAFAIGVASLRQGIAGVAEPFTRASWEYITDAQLVRSVPQFLRDYISLIPQLSMHGQGHPPGNAIVLYLLQSVFGGAPMTLALLVVAIGCTLLFPVYYFWRVFLPEHDVEDMLPVFMLTPSIVAFGATCMDILVPLFFWSALLTCVLGWRRSAPLSFAGGMVGGVALLLNFQFLVFGAVLLFFFLHRLFTVPLTERSTVLLRGVAAAAGFVSFYLALYVAFGFSIIANFRAAHAVHYAVVDAGAPAAVQYVQFALSNISGFFLYLGVVHLALFMRHFPRARGDRAHAALLYAGFGMVALLVLSGIYQAEVERLWLFLPPLFLPAMRAAQQNSGVSRGAVLSLLVLQIVTVEALFYTYW